jgi:hypothetical protein
MRYSDNVHVYYLYNNFCITNIIHARLIKERYCWTKSSVELRPIRFVIILPIQKFSHSLNLSRRRSININIVFKSEWSAPWQSRKWLSILHVLLLFKINSRTHSLQITSHTACKINNMTGSTSKGFTNLKYSPSSYRRKGNSFLQKILTTITPFSLILKTP